jgi:hypothetical protein
MVQRIPVSPPQLHSSQITEPPLPLCILPQLLTGSISSSTTMTDSTDTDRYFTELNSNSLQGRHHSTRLTPY